MRTCGEPFHKELAVSELLPELVRLSDRSAWCPPEVQQHVLALLQEWAYTLRPSQFVNSYNKLKVGGVERMPLCSCVCEEGEKPGVGGIGRC